MQALKMPVDTKLFTGMGGVDGGGDAADEYRRSLLPPLLENTGFDLNTALQCVARLHCRSCRSAQLLAAHPCPHVVALWPVTRWQVLLHVWHRAAGGCAHVYRVPPHSPGGTGQK